MLQVNLHISPTQWAEAAANFLEKVADQVSWHWVAHNPSPESVIKSALLTIHVRFEPHLVHNLEPRVVLVCIVEIVSEIRFNEAPVLGMILVECSSG